MLDYLAEEDSAIFECPACGCRLEEQILMDGVLRCPDCGEPMRGIS